MPPLVADVALVSRRSFPQRRNVDDLKRWTFHSPPRPLRSRSCSVAVAVAVAVGRSCSVASLPLSRPLLARVVRDRVREVGVYKFVIPRVQRRAAVRVNTTGTTSLVRSSA